MRPWIFAAILFAVAVKGLQPADPGTVVVGQTPADADAVKRILSSLGLGVDPHIDIACVLEHCVLQSVECLANEICREAVGCAQKCMAEWDNDTTKEKFHVQNCTNKCAFTYQDKVYANFMSCFGDHKCIAFPPIPNTCRSPDPGVHPLKQLSLDDLKGSWWVVKGFHPVYDCYPCQRLSFEPINATAWSYAPQYQVYLVNGSLTLVSQHMILPYEKPPIKNVSFVYHDVGLEHFETWWLIDKADDGSYFLMYYCGHTLQWYYEGALVFARNRTLPEEAYKNIAAAYQEAVGLSTSGFCNTSTASTCPEKHLGEA